jgi:hypothetical protein
VNGQPLESVSFPDHLVAVTAGNATTGVSFSSLSQPACAPVSLTPQSVLLVGAFNSSGDNWNGAITALSLSAPPPSPPPAAAVAASPPSPPSPPSPLFNTSGLNIQGSGVIDPVALAAQIDAMYNVSGTKVIPDFSVALSLILAGITLAQWNSPPPSGAYSSNELAFIVGMAASLGIPPSDIAVQNVTATSRRRLLASGGGLKVSFIATGFGDNGSRVTSATSSFMTAACANTSTSAPSGGAFSSALSATGLPLTGVTPASMSVNAHVTVVLPPGATATSVPLSSVVTAHSGGVDASRPATRGAVMTAPLDCAAHAALMASGAGASAQGSQGVQSGAVAASLLVASSPSLGSVAAVTSAAQSGAAQLSTAAIAAVAAGSAAVALSAALLVHTLRSRRGRSRAATPSHKFKLAKGAALGDEALEMWVGGGGGAAAPTPVVSLDAELASAPPAGRAGKLRRQASVGAPLESPPTRSESLLAEASAKKGHEDGLQGHEDTGVKHVFDAVVRRGSALLAFASAAVGAEGEGSRAAHGGGRDVSE